MFDQESTARMAGLKQLVNYELMIEYNLVVGHAVAIRKRAPSGKVNLSSWGSALNRCPAGDGNPCTM